MNHIHCLIWSQVSNTRVAISETAGGYGKGSSRSLIATVLLLGVVAASAAPLGGQVVSGTGNVVQSGATTTVQQSSVDLSLTWKSFNIAKHETVNFAQPSATAIALNRIYDINGTQILGKLNANGQVYLINPNGIVFGQGAQVNVGSIVASTLEIDDASLKAASRSFSGVGHGDGSVVNQGTITAANGGYVAMLGNTVSNLGTINVPQGTIALGAGSAATLTFKNNSLVSMKVDQSLLNSLLENGGLIKADGGQVLMGAGAKDSLLASVVNNTGVIQARTVGIQEGVIKLLGGMAAGTVNLDGTLDASAPYGSNGGFIETSALHLTISPSLKITTAATTGKTGSWLIDPVDFTIAATGGDITGAALSGLLANNSIQVQTVTGTNTAANVYGTAGGVGNINVNDAVNWSANKLTLTASNNININAKLSGSGSASLALEYGQGAVTALNASNYIVNAAVDLPSGQNFSTKLGSDGVVKNYTVINSLGQEGSTSGIDLQGMAGTSYLAENFVLGSNIDAFATTGWNGGFNPVGSNNGKFTGTFDGLGHTISNLAIARSGTNNVGLFGYTGAGSVIQNVGLTGGSVTGGDNTGSLVGNNESGSINNSYASINVMGYVGTGGLVGNNYSGNITNSYAMGDVNGAAGTGGLLGSNISGNIISSYATGAVTGAAGSGGLVGSSTSGSISYSFATGAVMGSDAGTGGLVGSNTSGNIDISYAMGNVTAGGAGTGGLVGSNTSGAISNTYAMGNVMGGGAGAGGLIGSSTSGPISNSYSTGTVTGAGGAVGGLVGISSGPVSNSFWDIDTSQTLTSQGGFGMHTADMKKLANFTTPTAANSPLTPNWDFNSVPTPIWAIVENVTYPLLKALMTQTTVTVNNDSTTYSGQSGSGYVGGNGAIFSDNMSGLTSNMLTYTGTSQGAKNAGSYVIQANGISHNQQNTLNFVNGVLTINPALLTVAGMAATDRYYNGSTTVTVTGGTIVGLIGNETLNFSGLMVDPSVGRDKFVTVVGTEGLYGGLSSNYIVTQPARGVTVNIFDATRATDATIKAATVATAVLVPISPPVPNKVFAVNQLVDINANADTDTYQDASTQLKWDVLASQVGTPAGALGLSSTLSVVHISSAGVAITTPLGADAGTNIQNKKGVQKTALALKILNDGMRMPSDVLNVD